MLSLLRHPVSICPAVQHLGVVATRSRAGVLTLRYVVSGSVGELELPPLSCSVRADGLWQHTCFEVFLRGGRDGAYHEFNFAPSSEWAAYRFDGYRSGMHSAEGIEAPSFDARASEETYALQVSLGLGALPELPNDGPWRLGLSAVIEERNGRKSYWALRHPAGKPDFHHPDCFALELP